MPFIPPVTVTELQNYLNDTSTDPNLITLYDDAINAATDRVYTYLGRSYPIGVQISTFWGEGSVSRRLELEAFTILSWTYRDTKGTAFVGDVSKLELFENGSLVIAHDVRFERGYEHIITYTPIPVPCPDAVRQVILEIAVTIFEESKHGRGILVIASEEQSGISEHYKELTARHRNILAPYRRYM